MIIRPATEKDLDQLSLLFYETINSINIPDYDAAQIQLWSSRHRDMLFWNKRFKEQYFLVAEELSLITGFCSLTDHGYLDFMYVHKDYQHQGIAKKLLSAIESQGLKLNMMEIHADVSITAKTFFEKQGFVTIKEQGKMLNGIEFINYAMRKEIR